MAALAARLSGLQPIVEPLAGWRGLGRFWIGLLGVAVIGAGTLQLLGPSASMIAAMSVADHAGAKHGTHELAEPKARTAPGPASALDRPGRTKSGPVAGPDPALLEPYPGHPDLKLPRISADGRAPMAVYASGYDRASKRPRIGMMIAGIGMSEAESLAAIKNLPASITLAVSPYAGDVTRLLDAARVAGHEYLLSIPMEPQGYPVNDPDDRHALMTALPPADNLERLRWVLARFSGYVGVTNALGQMRGERLSSVPDQFDSALEEVAHRGLLFVDARPGQATSGFGWNRSADLIIDEDPIDATTLAKRLDALSQIATIKGSALGIVSVPRPLTLDQVAAWTNTLAAKGLTLAPVSALAVSPTKEETGK